MWLFKKPKKNQKPPCKHYWIRDIRAYTYYHGGSCGSNTTTVDNKPKWRCKHCRVWEEDYLKNKTQRSQNKLK